MKRCIFSFHFVLLFASLASTMEVVQQPDKPPLMFMPPQMLCFNENYANTYQNLTYDSENGLVYLSNMAKFLLKMLPSDYEKYFKIRKTLQHFAQAFEMHKKIRVQIQDPVQTDLALWGTFLSELGLFESDEKPVYGVAKLIRRDFAPMKYIYYKMAFNYEDWRKQSENAIGNSKEREEVKQTEEKTEKKKKKRSQKRKNRNKNRHKDNQEILKLNPDMDQAPQPIEMKPNSQGSMSVIEEDCAKEPVSNENISEGAALPEALVDEWTEETEAQRERDQAKKRLAKRIQNVAEQKSKKTDEGKRNSKRLSRSLSQKDLEAFEMMNKLEQEAYVGNLMNPSKEEKAHHEPKGSVSQAAKEGLESIFAAGWEYDWDFLSNLFTQHFHAKRENEKGSKFRFHLYKLSQENDDYQFIKEIDYLKKVKEKKKCKNSAWQVHSFSIFAESPHSRGGGKKPETKDLDPYRKKLLKHLQDAQLLPKNLIVDPQLNPEKNKAYFAQ